MWDSYCHKYAVRCGVGGDSKPSLGQLVVAIRCKKNLHLGVKVLSVVGGVNFELYCNCSRTWHFQP